MESTAQQREDYVPNNACSLICTFRKMAHTLSYGGH